LCNAKYLLTNGQIKNTQTDRQQTAGEQS